MTLMEMLLYGKVLEPCAVSSNLMRREHREHESGDSGDDDTIGTCCGKALKVRIVCF